MMIRCLVLLLSLCYLSVHAQNNSDDWEDEDEWTVSVDTCAGNVYTIETSEEYEAVSNKRYEFTDITCDIELEGESYKEFGQRRDTVRMQIYRIANELFDFNNIPVLRREGFALHLSCFFRTDTKDYAGIQIFYDTELKEYFPLEKLYLLEQKLMMAGLNAGTTNVLDANSPYFEIYMAIYTGPMDTGW